MASYARQAGFKGKGWQVDRSDAAADSGEQRQALEAGLPEVGSRHGELTVVEAGRRAGGNELTVADLTGLGVKDAAGVALTARLADEHGAGQDVPLGIWRPW
jgi:ornithine cyclodeaminase/alanine dehydrogenase-like protein (mu-crystallin family)